MFRPMLSITNYVVPPVFPCLKQSWKKPSTGKVVFLRLDAGSWSFPPRVNRRKGRQILAAETR